MWLQQALSGSGATAPCATVSSVQDALFPLLHLLRLFLKTGLLILTPSPSCSAAPEAAGEGTGVSCRRGGGSRTGTLVHTRM